MEPIEIIVIIASVLIVGSVIITSIINKKKGKNGCCSDCSKCKNCSCKINVEKKEEKL